MLIPHEKFPPQKVQKMRGKTQKKVKMKKNPEKRKRRITLRKIQILKRKNLIPRINLLKIRSPRISVRQKKRRKVLKKQVAENRPV